MNFIACALVLVVKADYLNTVIDRTVQRSSIDTLLMFRYANDNITSKLPTLYYTSTSHVSEYHFKRKTLAVLEVADGNVASLHQYFHKVSSKNNVKHIFVLPNVTKSVIHDVFDTCWEFKVIYVLLIVNESIFSYSAFEEYPNLEIFEVDGFPEIPFNFNSFPLIIGSKFPINKGWDFYGIITFQKDKEHQCDLSDFQQRFNSRFFENECYTEGS